MKLIYQCHNQFEAERIRLLLESRGIPACITGAEINRVYPVTPHSLGVWAYIDEQEADAKALLDNPEHHVTTRVDVAGFYRDMQEQLDPVTLSRFNRKLILNGITVCLLLLLAFVLLAF